MKFLHERIYRRFIFPFLYRRASITLRFLDGHYISILPDRTMRAQEDQPQPTEAPLRQFTSSSTFVGPRWTSIREEGGQLPPAAVSAEHRHPQTSSWRLDQPPSAGRHNVFLCVSMCFMSIAPLPLGAVKNRNIFFYPVRPSSLSSVRPQVQLPTSVIH